MKCVANICIVDGSKEQAFNFCCTAAANMLLSMMALVIESRNRRVPRRVGITYGPLVERDRKRSEHLDDLIWRNDITCINMLRLRKSSFFRFCKLFRDRGLLRNKLLCFYIQLDTILEIG